MSEVIKLTDKLKLIANSNPEGCNQVTGPGCSGVSKGEKPPKSLPSAGKVEYMGFKLSKFEGTNVGYGGITHKLDSRGKTVSGPFDASKHHLRKSTRKTSGVETEYPDGGSKVHPSLKSAIKYIHQWHGIDA